MSTIRAMNCGSCSNWHSSSEYYFKRNTRPSFDDIWKKFRRKNVFIMAKMLFVTFTSQQMLFHLEQIKNQQIIGPRSIRRFWWLFEIHIQKSICTCFCYSQLWKLNASIVGSIQCHLSKEWRNILLCYTKIVINRIFNVFENIHD